MDDNNKNIPTLPENVDKILFAEDFLNYILGRFDLPLLPSELDYRPSSITNSFSAVTNEAENYFQLLKEKVLEEFMDISEQKSVDSNTFLKYASSLTCKLMEKSDETHSDSDCLMRFCVQISTMAARFYEHGISNAPDLAVEYMKNVFVGINIMEDGGFWNALNRKALGFSDQILEDIAYTPLKESEIALLSYDLSIQGNSDDSSSHNLERNGKYVEDVKETQMDPEKNFKHSSCKMCITCVENALPEEPDPSISVCSHVQKTIDINTENTNYDRTTKHHLSSESSKVETSKYSSHSFNETSSKDNSSTPARRENEENFISASNEINGKDDQDEQEIRVNPGNVIEDVACQICMAAMKTSPEAPGPSIYLCNHVEKTIEVRTENNNSDHTPDHLSHDHTTDRLSPDHTSDHLSPDHTPEHLSSDHTPEHLSSERAHKWDGISSHSSDFYTTESETSSEDETYKQKKQKRNSSSSFTFYHPRI